MEISSRSWHIRLNRYSEDRIGVNKFTLRLREQYRLEGMTAEQIDRHAPLHRYEPKNLCVHFWMTVGVLYALPFILVGQFSWHYFLRHLVRAVVIAALGIGVGSVWARGKRPRRAAQEPREPKPKEPSLVIEYLKARKRRICPLITVRED